MLNSEIKYLLDDIVFLNKNTNYNIVLNTNIEVSFTKNNIHYSEPVFVFSNPCLSKDEFEKLITLADFIKSKNSSISEIPVALFESLPFLKIIHFFVNEFYIINKGLKDLYNRISSENINPDYIKILEVPVVDILTDLFFIKINCSNNNQKEIFFTSDFDMTNLWTKLGFLRSVKRLLKFHRFSELKSFFLAKSNLKYNYILNDKMFSFNEHKEYKIRNIAFWLVHRNNNRLDFKNRFKSKSFSEYINLIGEKVDNGLHLSYNTSYQPDKIKKQITLFEEIFKQNPVLNRYHYLKYNLPEDLILLEQNNVKTDFSYCFHDSLLFRGGRTIPVKFWSFKENRVIDVISYPLFFMDVTFSTYLKVDLNEAENLAGQKIGLFKKYGHSCVLLWHNNNMYKYYEKNNYHPELFDFIKNKLLS